jgi:predicted RND superfamily exporter protein
VKVLVNALSRLVGSYPLPVLIVVLAISGVFFGFASQVEIVDGNEGFAPDAEELLADDRIGDLFGDGSSASVLQVVIDSDSGDVVTANGLAAVEAIREVIALSDLAPLIIETPDQPGIVSYLMPVQQAVGEGGASPPQSDQDLKQLYTSALADLPADVGGIAQQLLSGDRDIDAATAAKGLLLVFLDAPGFDEKVEEEGFFPTRDFDDFTDLEGEVAEAIRQVALPAGFTAEPFSIELIFGQGDEFQEEIGRLFGMAFMIIVVILLFVYWVKPQRGVSWVPGARRTGADMLLTMAAIVLAIFWMNGIGAILGPKYLDIIDDFGPMNQIIPILLIGLGVDYAIHLTTRYREEVGHAGDVTSGMLTSIHTVGIALILATITTAVGFLTNLVSPIPALKDFGILAAVGILSSFVIMLTFVASFRILMDSRAEAKGVLPVHALGTTKERLLPQLIGRLSVLAERFAWQTVSVAVLVGVIGFVGVLQLKVEFSVTDFVPRPNPLLPTFDTLIEDFGGGFGETTQVLVEGEVATPQAHNALVEATGNLRTTENVLQFGDDPAVESPLSLIATLTDEQGDRFSPEVSAAAQATGLGDDLTVAGGADVGTLYDSLFVAVPEEAARVLSRAGDGSFRASLSTITTQGGESGAAQLNTDVRAAFAPVTATGLSAVPTSDEIINNVVITSLSDSQLSSLVITVLAAAGLLMLNFFVEARRPGLGLITIFPVALVMLWAFGLMPVLGLAFGPVTATVSALAIGIGVPYMIHITHRFQEDRTRFATPEEAIKSTTTNTGGALAGSAFTTVAGFGILMTASLVPFQQLGLVTAYTIAMALVGAVVVLPSMLVLWDRWHRRRGEDPIDSGALARALEVAGRESEEGAAAL